MRKTKAKWKGLFLLSIIIVASIICIKEKHFYKSLFSKEFCESIVGIQYITYDNEIYTIADEEMIDEFRTVLYETQYRRLRGADGIEKYSGGMSTVQLTTIGTANYGYGWFNKGSRCRRDDTFWLFCQL